MRKIIVSFVFAIIISINFCGCGIKNDNDVDLNNYKLEINNDKRLFKTEVCPKTEGEKLILDYYKIFINDNYEELKKINYNNIDDEVELIKENLEKGIYTTSITVHSIKQIKESDYKSDYSNPLYYPNIDRLIQYDPYKFEMIQINYTQTLSEESKGVQYGSGDYLRCFAVTKESRDSEWKIFDRFGAY